MVFVQVLDTYYEYLNLSILNQPNLKKILEHRFNRISGINKIDHLERAKWGKFPWYVLLRSQAQSQSNPNHRFGITLFPLLVKTAEEVGFAVELEVLVLSMPDGTEVVFVGIETLNWAQTEAKRLSKATKALICCNYTHTNSMETRYTINICKEEMIIGR